MKIPSNIEQLRSDLLKVYTGVRTQKISIGDATAANNTAGKIITSCKVQLDYAKLQGVAPDVDFLEI